MSGYIYIFPCLLYLFIDVRADYTCVCIYNVENAVYAAANDNSALLGYMYEFDCKPHYANTADVNGFSAIQFEHHVGYIESSSQVEIQTCPGDPHPLDIVNTSNTVPSQPTTITKPTFTSIPLSSHSTAHHLSPSTKPLTTRLTTTSSPPPTTTTTSSASSPLPHASLTSTSRTSTTASPAVTTVTTPSSTSSQTTTQLAVTSPIVSSTTTLSTAASSTVPPYDCPPDWVMFESSCYQFYTDNQHKASWEPAQSQCKSQQSHLAIVDSSPEDRFLVGELSSRLTQGSAPVWLGGTDEHHEKEWLWEDDLDHPGYQYPVTYTNWAPGQPDNANHDDCITIDPSQSLKWADYPCSERNFFVCEKPVRSTSALYQTSYDNCAHGWVANGASCYKFQTSDKKDWSGARNNCDGYHSHLVAIETSSEANFLKQELSHRIGTDGGFDDTAVWTDGSDALLENTWLWYTSHASMDTQFFQNWHHSEPDAGDGEHEEDCMAMVGEDSFEWHDIRCSTHSFYVCEKNRPVQSILTPPPSPGCPGGWTRFESSCYYMSSTRNDWSSANTYCYHQHAHLAIIDCANENQFLSQEMSKIIPTQASQQSETGVWLAGRDIDVEGVWEWADLISHKYEPIMTQSYQNWYPGEPDAGDGDHEEDCMGMIGETGYQWHDHRCSDHMFFVCEMPAHGYKPQLLAFG